MVCARQPLVKAAVVFVLYAVVALALAATSWRAVELLLGQAVIGTCLGWEATRSSHARIAG